MQNHVRPLRPLPKLREHQIPHGRWLVPLPRRSGEVFSAPSWVRSQHQRRNPQRRNTKLRKIPNHRDDKTFCGNCRARLRPKESDTPRMSEIADESERGVDRHVDGAATMPKTGQPLTQAQFFKPASSFQRIGRGVTQRRGGRPRYQKAKSRKSASGQTALSHLFIGSLSFSLPLPVMRTDHAQAKHDGLSHLAPFYRHSYNTHDPTPIVDQSSDLSGQSQSEFAAVLADYAGKIDAARRSLPPPLAAAVVRALANEQTVALRALSERLQATTKKKQDDKPIRTTGQAPQSNDRSL